MNEIKAKIILREEGELEKLIAEELLIEDPSTEEEIIDEHTRRERIFKGRDLNKE